jgi:hypothetical protein
MTAVGGVYTTMWNVYLNEELKYTSTSPFLDLNDKAYPAQNRPRTQMGKGAHYDPYDPYQQARHQIHTKYI